MTGAEKAAGPSALPFYLLAVIGAAAAVVADGVAVAASLWLLPSLTCLIIERERGRPMVRAMTLFGLAAALPGFIRVWMLGGGLDAGTAMAFDPLATAIVWSAQGLAWVLAEIFPVLLVLRAEWSARGRLRRLEAARRDLQEEWSPS